MPNLERLQQNLDGLDYLRDRVAKDATDEALRFKLAGLLTSDVSPFTTPTGFGDEIDKIARRGAAAAEGLRDRIWASKGLVGRDVPTLRLVGASITDLQHEILALRGALARFS
jgi:hypothetical protein